MIHRIKNDIPTVHPTAFVAPSAEVAGLATICEGATVWFSASVRGDIAPIVIGKNSNVQDGAVIHCDTGIPCEIGENVTVGHGAIVHSAKIGDGCLIGMGAIVMNGAVIGEGSIVGAGSLVTNGKTFPPRSMILGSPAKAVRETTEEECRKSLENAAHYVALGRDAKNDYRETEGQ